MKVYMLEIHDGERVYYEYTLEEKDIKEYTDFMRAVKNITKFEVTDEELKVLQKFKVV